MLKIFIVISLLVSCLLFGYLVDYTRKKIFTLWISDIGNNPIASRCAPATKVVETSQIIFNTRLSWGNLVFAPHFTMIDTCMLHEPFCFLSLFRPCQELTQSYMLCMYPWVLVPLSLSLLGLCQYFKYRISGNIGDALNLAVWRSRLEPPN